MSVVLGNPNNCAPDSWNSNQSWQSWSEDVVQATPAVGSNDCQVSSSESPQDKKRTHNLDWPPFSSPQKALQVQNKSFAMFPSLPAIKRCNKDPTNFTGAPNIPPLIAVVAFFIQNIKNIESEQKIIPCDASIPTHSSGRSDIWQLNLAEKVFLEELLRGWLAADNVGNIYVLKLLGLQCHMSKNIKQYLQQQSPILTLQTEKFLRRMTLPVNYIGSFLPKWVRALFSFIALWWHFKPLDAH